MISAPVGFARPAEDGSRALGLSFALAAAVHVGVALGTYRHPTPAVAPIVTEIVLAPPVTEPEPPPAPPPTELPAAPLPATVAPVAPPPVARAGALLTRRDEAPSKPAENEPADFVTAPDGTFYGSGVVARGGTADIGLPSAATAGAAHRAAPASLSAGDPIARASDLSRGARLIARDPCRGRYPSDARADMADVTLSLVVEASGELRRATVLGEAPPGQGFAEAARRCVAAQRLEPALSKAGTPVTSVTTLVVHFSR